MSLSRRIRIAWLPLCLVLGTGAVTAHGTQGRQRPRIKSVYSRTKASQPLPDTHLVTIQNCQLVTKAQYNDLSKAIQVLFEKYHPDNHYFIGTGGDPAPI